MYLFCVGQGCALPSAHVQVRAQFVGLVSLILSHRFWDRTQVHRLGAKCH